MPQRTWFVTGVSSGFGRHLIDPAPLRMVLGSQALESPLTTLRKRVAGLANQTDVAASIDFPPGE